MAANRLPWQPTLKGRFWWGSGDGNPTDGKFNTLTTLYPFGHYYWGLIDNFNGANLLDYSVQFSVKPAKKLTWLAAWHWFDRVQPHFRAGFDWGCVKTASLRCSGWELEFHGSAVRRPGMSIAGVRELGKGDSLVEMVAEIDGVVQRAAAEGVSLREFERGIFDRLLKMGHAATEQFLTLQGDGDRGATVLDDDGRTLFRSEKPAKRPLRTIFGEHQFEAYVNRRRRHPNTPIALRPVDERLGIEPDRFSPLLQEFTMLFGIEQAFDTAAEAFEAIFRQKLSVDTLEKVSRRMGTQAGEFLDSLEPPPPDEEGELLVQTADGKGVPMVREDARS